jgi:hypothetical protein
MNQYRCETCGYYQTHHINMCDIVERLLNAGEITLISKIGCASHSDFQSERDKLAELEQWAWDNRSVFFNNNAYNPLLEKLKELRKAGES